MNAGPYSNKVVQDYLQEEFTPIKSECFWDKRTETMKQFDISWTPTLIVLDATGREHHRMVGYVPTDDFLAHLKLGKGKVHFDRFRFVDAIREFTAVIEEHPAACVVPEAIFFLGVATYWNTHDAKELRRAYDTLVARFPQNEWARRAKPYEQIPL